MSRAETEQREAQLRKVMVAMAKAHDRIVSEREHGALLALQAGSGMATTYWREIAKAAKRAILTGAR